MKSAWMQGIVGGVARALAPLSAAGCAEQGEASPALGVSAAEVPARAAALPHGPLRLAYVPPSAAGADPMSRPKDEAIISIDETGLHDASGDWIGWPRTTDANAGIFGYVLQDSPLTTESGEMLGRIAADAKVRVTKLKEEGGVERAEVMLPAWTSAGGADDGPLRAWMPARSLAARPIGEAARAPVAAPGSASSQRRSVPLRDPRWQTLAYTFCGTLDVVGPVPATGLARVEQHDGGITLFGLVETGDLEVTTRCPRPVLVRERAADGVAGAPRLVFGNQTRRYEANEPPAGLIAADEHGAKLATVVKKKKTLYLVADDGARLRCQAWSFGATQAGVSSLASEQQLANGDELSVALDATLIPGSPTSEEILAVSGPTAEIIGKGATAHRPEHATPRCGRQYRVVGADASSLTVFRGKVASGASVVAYAPADAERWFTDRTSCEEAIASPNASYVKSGLAAHDLCE
jgi:hypothetical protein